MLRGNKITTLNLDEELVEKAQEYGLNLSKWINGKLREFFSGSISINSPIQKTEPSGIMVHMSDDFKSYLKANRADKKRIDSLERDLNKHFKGPILSSPQDVIYYVSKMKTESKYPILALRVYIKYLEETAQMTSELATKLRKVPKVKKSKPDNYVPTEEKVKESFNKLSDGKDKLLFQVLAFSGVRVTEMVKMLKEFDGDHLIKNEKFDRYNLNYKRGQKNSFYIYMPIEIAQQVKRYY